MMRSQEDWIKCFEEMEALWIHSGDSNRPHALLTSGKHSDGFFNSGLVLQNSAVADHACGNLLSLLKEGGLKLNGVDRVIGPAMGAVTLADGVARNISHQRGRPCLFSYTIKKGWGRERVMAFDRVPVKRGERVLLVEDVCTTGSSVSLVAKTVETAGGEVLPYVATLVNRSGLQEIEGRKMVALVDREMPMWEPGDCPLCPKGSEAIRPKGNWGRLTGGS